ncbi:Endoplasmic reticulum-Golgi intermediate compartment protein 3 [Morella rubra]|uniref:Endoplasmic reticulum-Golgi intermediate compartment protein 3 n=1 Tax=Morella rubra TaxID=262757 RepID=A0A6A1V2I1_9ROSI|nr:Endoplasmic reticulum-Golgi intermediate compartment protein 3 [Morella rubra]
MDKVLHKLRNLDAYPKINEDFYSRTFSGGLITLVSLVVMFLLFFSELRLYLHTVSDTKLVVDTSRGQKLHINFDITFPAVPCSLLSLDAMDISGERHHDIRHDIVKKRIDSHGNVIEVKKDGIGAKKIEKPLQKHGGRLEHNEKYCGSCYGAEMSDDHCCNSCEEVREAYTKKGWALTNMDLIDQCEREGFIQKVKGEEGEGCNIYGSLEVNKVAGNFHFVPGKSFHQSNVHVYDLLALQRDSHNISHRINKLAFGDHFPGLVNPLDGVRWVPETPNGMYQYFIKVVPTIYTSIRGRTVHSNQYSVTEHLRTADVGYSQSLPGVFFFYDISPIKVTFKEEHVPFLHFMTHISAIIGDLIQQKPKNQKVKKKNRKTKDFEGVFPSNSRIDNIFTISRATLVLLAIFIGDSTF